MLKKADLTKENKTKILAVLILATIFFITLSLLSDDHDNRLQISDNNGATETALCNILSEVKDVGKVNVLIQYEDKSAICGVIVTAEGAGDPIVKNNIVKGVSTLFDIPVSSVIVYEKTQEDVE